MDFIKKNWLWLLVGGVAVWYFYGKKSASSSGSAANPVSAVADAAKAGYAGLSTAWATAQQAIGLA